MKKISVANVPPILELVASGNDEEGNVLCQGLTAKLHSRIGGLQDEKQGSRLIRKESFIPPIPSSRSSVSSRKSSSPREPEGFYPNTLLGKDQDKNSVKNGLQLLGETGYLAMNSRKKSTADKLSDTGFQLYTLEDSKKLPKILKPKKKGAKGSKRKKIKDDQSTTSNESQGDLITNKLDAQSNKGNLDDPSAEDTDELYNKYGLDLKREFDMKMTRPFTYSYFPKIYSKKKNSRNKDMKKNNKLRKISKIETKTPLC